MPDTYEFRDNNVALLGDTHSVVVTKHIVSSTQFPSDMDVVFMGDGGEEGERDERFPFCRQIFGEINEILKAKNTKIYWIRGNHSNTNIWKGGWEFSNIIFVKDGDVGVFPNKKRALFLGGGISLDRYTREEGYDYWADEPTPNLDNVAETDFVFAHDAPECFNHSTLSLGNRFGWYIERDDNLIDDCLKQRKVMGDLCKKSGARFIASGHFHNHHTAEEDGVKYRCLGINELWEFKSDQY